MNHTWKLIWLCATTAAMAMMALSHNAYPATPAEAGRTLAQQYCAECHATAADAKNGWTDAPGFDVIANKPGATASTLSAYIQIPHMHMLNTGRPPNEAADIAAYILTFRNQ